MGLVGQNEAVCGAVLIVAWSTAPAPLLLMETGLCRPKFAQLRLSKELASRPARKVYRLSPAVGTGDGPAVSSFSLAATNAPWMFIRFWQNICGLLLAWFWLVTGGCPISDR